MVALQRAFGVVVAAAVTAHATNSDPAFKLTMTDGVVNHALSSELPHLQDLINNEIVAMNNMTLDVLTFKLYVGPFEEGKCGVASLNESTVAISAEHGVDATARFYLNCEAPYKMTNLGIPFAHGTMTLHTKGTSYVEDVSNVVATDGHVQLVGADVSTNFKLDIWFTGLVGTLLSAVLKVFEPIINWSLDRAITKAIEEGITTVNEALAQLPLQVDLGRPSKDPVVTLDAAALEATAFDGYLTLGLDSSFQPPGEPLANKSNPFDLPVALVDLDPNLVAAAQLALSDYVPQTLLWVLQAQGALDLLIPSNESHITTTILLPVAPKMARKYPGADVQVEVAVTKVDASAFSTTTVSDAIIMALPLDLTFQPVVNDVPQNGFTIGATADFGLTLDIAQNAVNNTESLTGSVTALDVSGETVVHSDVGTVNLGPLDVVLNSVLYGVEAAINTFLQTGLELPAALTNSSIRIGPGEVRLASDFDLDAGLRSALQLPLNSH